MENTTLTPAIIISLMQTDLYTYGEHLERINDNLNYFTENDGHNLSYWSDWFRGSDMSGY